MEALEIQVLSGVHAGARYAVTLPRFRLAGDEHSELVLLDEGIEDVEIAFEVTGAGDLSIMSRADYEVVDAAGMPVRPSTRWGRGQFLVIAGVWLALASAGVALLNRPARREPELAQLFSAALARPQPSAAVLSSEADRSTAAEAADPNRKEVRRARKLATLALGAIIAMVLTAGLGVALVAVSAENSLGQATAAAEAAQLKRLVVALSATSATLGPSAEETAAMRVKVAREALNRSVERAELATSVTMEWGRDGDRDTVVVQATINPSMLPKFEQMMFDFERDHGASVKVAAKVVPLWTLLPFRIREVVPGPSGWVVTDKGERVLVGGEVSGYKLSSLAPNKVVLEGPRHVEIDL